MNRNEFIRKLKEVINNSELSNDTKSDQITQLCQKYEQGYGGSPLRKLLEQVQKETGFDMSQMLLMNEVGVIENKHGYSEVDYIDTDSIDCNNCNDADNDDNGNTDDGDASLTSSVLA